MGTKLRSLYSGNTVCNRHGSNTHYQEAPAHNSKMVHFWTKLSSPMCPARSKTPTYNFTSPKSADLRRENYAQIKHETHTGVLTVSSALGSGLHAFFYQVLHLFEWPNSQSHLWAPLAFCLTPFGPRKCQNSSDSVGRLFLSSRTAVTVKPMRSFPFSTCAWIPCETHMTWSRRQHSW